MSTTIQTILNNPGVLSATSAILGAVIGGGFSAWATNKFNMGTKAKDDLLKEINNTNAGIIISASICNDIANFKNQNSRPLEEHYTDELIRHSRFQAFKMMLPASSTNTFHVNMVLLSLPTPTLQTKILQSKTIDQLNLKPRPIATILLIIQTYELLTIAIEKREVLVDKFKGWNQQTQTTYYLGINNGNGHHSTEYPDLINAIKTYADDLIFYSQLLTKDLKKHGDKTLEKYKLLEKKTDIKIQKFSFSNLEKKNLLPNEEEYQDWLSNFPEAPKECTKKTLLKLKAKICSMFCKCSPNL